MCKILAYNMFELSDDEKDVKPLFFPSPATPTPSDTRDSVSTLVSDLKKWSPNVLQDGNRKSAFLPYKQTTCNTALTNLQRGNTQADTTESQSIKINFHIRAGQGDLTEHEVARQANVDALDEHELTALHWASAYGQLNMAQLLLKYKARVNILGPEEESPLLLAAAGGHLEVVRLLLNNGADVNHVDHMCNSALMYAAKGNHPHTCQELLLYGANFSLMNLNDDTAHSIAVDQNSTLAQTVIENFIMSKIETSVCYPDSTVDGEG